MVGNVRRKFKICVVITHAVTTVVLLIQDLVIPGWNDRVCILYFF